MKINEVTTAIKLGVVDYNDKTYNGPKHVAYDRKISINWDSSLSKEIKTSYPVSYTHLTLPTTPYV